MIYFIDGYNFIFATDKEKSPIEVSRAEVLEDISEKSADVKVVVVFDAYNDSKEMSRFDYKNIEVIYTSPGQTADEFFLEQVSFTKNLEQMTIVSNDRKLLKELALLRANTMSFSSFFKKIKKLKSKELEKPESSQFGSKDYEYYLKKFKE